MRGRVWMIGWLVAAGGCAAEVPVIFEEDFECGAGLCGWKAERDGVEVVETIQPGEHALRLPGPGRVRYRFETARHVDACAVARLITDCHWGDDGGRWRELEAVMERGALVLRLSPQDYDLGFYPQAAPVPAAAIAAIVVEDIRGACRVDAIRVEDAPCADR